jgi:hypothetical protein
VEKWGYSTGEADAMVRGYVLFNRCKIFHQGGVLVSETTGSEVSLSCGGGQMQTQVSALGRDASNSSFGTARHHDIILEPPNESLVDAEVKMIRRVCSVGKGRCGQAGSRDEGLDAILSPPEGSD